MLKINKRAKVVADDELDVMIPEGEAEVDVTPEASDLLFEAEDVAELVAEVTGQDVEVEAEDDTVTFTVGEDEYVVEAEGDEEVLEAVRRPLAKKSAVRASQRSRVVSASRKPAKAPQSRVVRRRPVK